MKYNIINVNSDKKQTFTNKYGFLALEKELVSQGYKQLTVLKRKTAVKHIFTKKVRNKKWNIIL